MKTSFRISLIISVYKRIDFLDLVLKSIDNQSYRNFEVIIAEDDESDTTKKFIDAQKIKYSFPIEHLSQEDQGFRKNKILNQAVLKSKGEYLVFIDGDCILHRNYLREYERRLDENLCLFGRRVRLSSILTKELIKKNDPEIISFFKMLISGTKRIEDAVYLPFSVSKRTTGMLGCSFCIARKHMIEINGFDEDFIKPLYGEDTDVARRLKLLNIKFLCTKFNTILYHLYHEVGDRRAIKAENKKLYEIKERQGLIVCQNGLVKFNEEISAIPQVLVENF